AGEEGVGIGGYGWVDELAGGEERAVKEGLGGRFWTVVHWTNWRVFLPWSREQQQRVAAETLAELDRGNPVQLLVTNLPKVELNHTVGAYDYRRYHGAFFDFLVYAPPKPAPPGSV